jgi:hypothetical protein
MVCRLVPTERNCVSNILRMLTERNRFRKALTPTRKDWNESRNAEGDSRINAYEDSRINAYEDPRINAYEDSRINAYERACDYFSGELKKKAARVERKDEGTSRSEKTRYLASASWPIYQDPVIHTVHEEFQHDHRSGS